MKFPPSPLSPHKWHTGRTSDRETHWGFLLSFLFFCRSYQLESGVKTDWARRAMLPSSYRSPLGSHFISSPLQLLQDAPQASPGSMEAWQNRKSCLPPLSTQAAHRAFQFGDSPTSHLLFKLPQELLKPRYFSFSFSFIYIYRFYLAPSQSRLSSLPGRHLIPMTCP